MLYIGVGLAVVVIAVAWYAARSHRSALEAQLAAARQQLDARYAELGQSRESLATAVAERRGAEEQLAEKQRMLNIHAEALAQSREEVLRLTADTSRLSTEVDEQKKSNEKQLKLWGEAEQHFKDAFDAIASHALKSNNQQFLELAKQELERQQKTSSDDLSHKKDTIAGMLNETKERLGKMDDQVRLMEGERQKAYGDITAQITGLVSLQHELSDETRRLSQALKKPDVRGSWGSLQLKNAAELSGMTEHCDFAIEQTVTIEDKKRRPDMVITMPTKRTIIVDAKVSLDAFIDAANVEDPIRYRELMEKHARQIREHIDGLSSKNYFTAFNGSTDLVVAFIPGESLYIAALQYDPKLLEYSVQKKVLLATPMTLIALLRAIYYGWKEERLAQNAQQICEIGKELHRRIATVSEHLKNHRKALNSSVDTFNEMLGSLERNAITQARKFENLDAGSEKIIEEVDPMSEHARNLQEGKWKQPTIIRALAASAADRD
ncbi:MAG: DNA recombination protein RmuC [Acidobacteriaceae bacterium]